MILKTHLERFEALRVAFEMGNASLLEYVDKRNGKKIVAITQATDTGSGIDVVPAAFLAEGIEWLIPMTQLNPTPPGLDAAKVGASRKLGPGQCYRCKQWWLSRDESNEHEKNCVPDGTLEEDMPR